MNKLAPSYGSDVMAEVIRSMGFRYAAINPGASFRGLHDSIVNYCQNEPELIQCLHENVAVGVAHGYAKATGNPMAVLLHDVVGLLHGAMGIYCAYMDRAPLVIFGGAGPMALEKRRPNIDWIHSANVQGNAVREYTKWDDQPASIASVAPTVARATRVALAEPQGPVYVAFDAALQEAELDTGVTYPDFSRLRQPSRIGADSGALRELARLLVSAERPVIIPGYAGRDQTAFDLLVELAELLGAGVIDGHHRLNFPNSNPCNAEGTAALQESDLVFFIDVKDMEVPTKATDHTTRERRGLIPENAVVVDLGFNDLGISSWTHDFASFEEVDHQVTADTVVALPQLVAVCRAMVGEESEDRHEWRSRHKRRLARMHAQVWEGWWQQAQAVWNDSPVSTARLVTEVWDVVKGYDWVLTAGTASDWAYRVWDFDQAYRHLGKSLGTGTQISISVGAALAHRDYGRLVVDLQPDGDLLYDPSALWTASYHCIPLLVVMFNNRSYNNDWAHQERMAQLRGRPLQNANLGMELDRPAPDFAAIARSFGWYGEGPIVDGDQVGAAVRRAVDVVMGEGQPALVDVVCQRQ